MEDVYKRQGKGYWNLRWYSENSGENLSVSVDASKQNIVSINYYKDSKPGRYSGMPAYSREQAEKIANQLIQKLFPEQKNQFQLSSTKENNEILPREREYPIEYYISYVRIHEGIEVSGQGMQVTVNGENGEITGYNYTWDDASVLPSSQSSITMEEAKKIFQDKGGFALTYFMPKRYGLEQPNPLQLVYRPKLSEGVFINALTGELVDTDEWYIACLLYTSRCV